MRTVSKVLPAYPEVDVEYEVTKLGRIKLISVKESGREIVHLLKPSTEDSIRQDCKKHYKGERDRKRKERGS